MIMSFIGSFRNKLNKTRKQVATLCMPGSVSTERGGGWLAKSELLGSCRGYAEAVSALTAVASKCVHGTYHRRCDAPPPDNAEKNLSCVSNSIFTISSSVSSHHIIEL